MRSASEDNLWGAKAIGRYLGRSVDAVYDLAVDPDAPIYKPSGRYYARKSEIDRWLRQKPKARDCQMLPDFT